MSELWYCDGCGQVAHTHLIVHGSKYELCKDCRNYYYWHGRLRNQTMTPDELYQQGYDDGKAGEAANASYVHDENYEMGYLDGSGDRSRDRPVDNEFAIYNDPPAGFEFVGRKRVAQPGEWYLTKNGNAKQQVGVRGNAQTRHILRKL